MPREDYPDSWDRVHVQCPFYRRSDGKKRISCEGMIPDTTITNLFHRKRDYTFQIQNFCCDGYETCEVYIATMGSKEW